MAVTSAARALPAPRKQVQERPRLTLLRSPATQESNFPFLAMCVAIGVAFLLAMLFLNIALAQGAFTLRSQQIQSTKLAEQQQALEQQVETQQAPQRLAQRASQLGMVAGPNPAFVRLSNGTIVGSPQAAQQGTAATPTLPQAMVPATSTTSSDIVERFGGR